MDRLERRPERTETTMPGQERMTFSSKGPPSRPQPCTAHTFTSSAVPRLAWCVRTESRVHATGLVATRRVRVRHGFRCGPGRAEIRSRKWRMTSPRARKKRRSACVRNSTVRGLSTRRGDARRARALLRSRGRRPPAAGNTEQVCRARRECARARRAIRRLLPE